MTIVSTLITSVMLLVINCGNSNDPTKNNKAGINTLTVSINSNDYDISFDADNTAVLIIPATETIPGKVQVTAVSLSDGATGLAVGKELTITEGKAAMTITAEDGSIQSEYTLTIAQITAEEMSRTQAMDRRYHYVAFTVQSQSGANLGRFKFGLKAVSEKAPTASELGSGDGIYRKVTGLTSRNILAYTLDSGIGAYVSRSEVQNEVVLHGNNGADVDQYLLVPDEEYALYAMKDGSGTVFKLAAFSTDEFDANSSPFEDGKISDESLLEGQYVYDPQDTVFLMPYFLATEKIFSASLNLNVEIAPDNSQILVIVGNAGSGPTFGPSFGITGMSALFPSQVTDGTNYSRTIAGKQVSGFFVCISQPNLSTYSYNDIRFSVSYLAIARIPSFELVFHLTQD